MTDLSIPFRRPEDYFAQMLKSDDQMKKIKGRILYQTRSLEQSEAAQKIREQRKFGKQVQLSKKKEAQKKKKDQLDMINKWKKGRQLGTESRSIDDMLEETMGNKKEQKPRVNLKRQRKVLCWLVFKTYF